MYSQIYARNVDRNNSADGEREANTNRAADTATRERRIIILIFLIRLAAMLPGMYYVEILGYRYFPDLLRVRGG